jgi:hypothetical protein
MKRVIAALVLVVAAVVIGIVAMWPTEEAAIAPPQIAAPTNGARLTSPVEVGVRFPGAAGRHLHLLVDADPPSSGDETVRFRPEPGLILWTGMPEATTSPAVLGTTSSGSPKIKRPGTSSPTLPALEQVAAIACILKDLGQAQRSAMPAMTGLSPILAVPRRSKSPASRI